MKQGTTPGLRSLAVAAWLSLFFCNACLAGQGHKNEASALPDDILPVAEKNGPFSIGSLSNNRADTVEGAIFSLSTDRTAYRKNQTVSVCYSIQNRTMGTVLFDFATSCQLDVRIENTRGKVVFSSLAALAVKTCKGERSRISLSSGAQKSLELVTLPLKEMEADTLTLIAQMAGYPLSAVSVKVYYQAAAADIAPAPMALEGSAGHRLVLEFNQESKMLVIRVGRTERLTISAFILTGQKMNKMSCEKILAPGTHLINFNNKKLMDGVVIFKVEGNGFSESKTINLTR